jgi:hypothetical protein
VPVTGGPASRPVQGPYCALGSRLFTASSGAWRSLTAELFVATLAPVVTWDEGKRHEARYYFKVLAHEH